MNAVATPKLLEQYRRNKIRVDELNASLSIKYEQMFSEPMLHFEHKLEAKRIRKAWQRLLARDSGLQSELFLRFSQARGTYAPYEDFVRFLNE